MCTGLAGMRVALLLCLAHAAVSAATHDKAGGSPRVAIVGAGMAGLSAGRRLRESGVESFEIFEAMERIGGRIHSIPYHGGYLQQGAQFINGDKNPIYNIAEPLGVVSGELSDLDHFDEATWMSGHCPLSKPDLVLFKSFIAPLDPLYRHIAATDEIVSRNSTIKTLYDKDYAEFVQKHNISGYRRDLFDSMSRVFRSYWEFEWASDWEDQSLRNLADWDDLGAIGVSYTTDKIGYKAIIDEIARPSRDRIHLSSPVSNIDYGKNGVTLTLANGTSLPFDYVLVTASLGHLKRFHHSLFTPPLPRAKRHAIETIGFGGSSKVFLRWREPFWAEGTHSLAPLPIRGCGRRDVDPFDDAITTMQTVDWAPATLMLWLAGKGPRIFDEMDDQEVIDRVTTLLRDVTGNRTLEAPVEIVRSKLTHNPYLMGSYSYVSLEQAKQRIPHYTLAIPLKVEGRPRVLFAGEATHHRVFQTAVGAFLSGRREVDRLLSDFHSHSTCHHCAQEPHNQTQ